MIEQVYPLVTPTILGPILAQPQIEAGRIETAGKALRHHQTSLGIQIVAQSLRLGLSSLTRFAGDLIQRQGLWPPTDLGGREQARHQRQHANEQLQCLVPDHRNGQCDRRERTD